MAAHLHLDATGGVAGDMFAAAMGDLDPELLSDLVPLLRSAGLAEDVAVGLVDHRDETFRGRRFTVDDPREKGPRRGPGTFVFQRQHAAHAGHAHVPFADILAQLKQSALSPGALARAVDIFTRLAIAEGGVHGVALDDVAFHEVGSQDSVADIVTAAIVIDRLDARHGGLTASVSSLPTGSGRVQTAHGELPVPAPATLALLQGLMVHDDGRPGERVTPTGAAIVRHLLGDALLRRRPPGVVAGVGIGFGTRVFAGLSNIVRATLTVAESADSTGNELWNRRALAILQTEVDDMTAEELAWAADSVRAVAGVVDVLQMPVFMKKGRAGTRLQVLCSPETTAAAARALFATTSTLGIRVGESTRFELSRSEEVVGELRVKRVQRAEGPTGKADHDDVTGSTLAERRAVRATAEAAVHPGPHRG